MIELPDKFLVAFGKLRDGMLDAKRLVQYSSTPYDVTLATVLICHQRKGKVDRDSYCKYCNFALVYHSPPYWLTKGMYL